MKSATQKFVAVATAALLGTTALAVPTFAANVPEGVTLADEQTFTYRVLDEHSSVDPQIVEDVTGSELVRDLFEGLLNQNADGELVPGVATEWSANEDNTQWTFKLREDAKWSDGTAVTAGDFVYAWKRLVNPELASPYAWFGELMSIENAAEIIAGDMEPSELGVEAPDEHTLVVNLSAPLPYFPAMTTHASTFPSPQWVIEEHGDAWTRPENIVTNGAYVLTEHVPQERSVRVKSDTYWDAENTVLETVTALVINDENQALTRFLAGELDRTEVPTGQYPRLKEEHPDAAISFPRLCTYYYNVNLRENGPEALKDVKVRQALAYAIDRNVITDQILQGGQTPAYTFTPGATANFEVPSVPFAEMTQAERDEAAKSLMEEAGYGSDNPLELSILYNTSEAHREVATVIAQMWEQKLGVTTTLNNMEWNTFLEARGNGDYEVARAGWCGDYNEASTFLDLMQTESGYNDSAYSNEEVDSLLSEAKTLTDPSANYTRVEEIVAEEMPVLPIYHYAGVYMLNPQIQEWPVNNVEQNWYSKDLYRVAE
ncbi:oligopeptide transport system substrate-binding protein [Devosia subaequoris]|uniref:Oligopeptide transport system substrate-binding protein n=1 Tax=Devosia subaequoris TaxID=395930 RepID=A0A7W6INX8_9HYPH|nr:peptide ABC transporter substrate-binding protein [Devosia subaequoris]MBB4052672.1 oligopeptide transport system substrate-binding protein [Devosia subaequoris]MCP1209828.1 peptide ABC transporter substrate-binding protein [Devosia subaequoris]